jgi:hypothetical protein
MAIVSTEEVFDRVAHRNNPIAMRTKIDSGMEIIFSSLFLFLYSVDSLPLEIPL